MLIGSFKIKKRAFERGYIYTLIYIFLLYGAYYFFHPEAIEDSHSVAKYVRFIIVALLWGCYFTRTNKKKIISYILISLSLFILASVSNGKEAIDYINILNFIAPISSFVLYKQLREYNLTRVIRDVYIVSSAFSYIEIFLMGGIYERYNMNGLRSASIFLNPNSYGCFLVIMAIYICIKSKLFAVRIISVINSLLILYLTGSRSSIVVMILMYGLMILIWIIKEHEIIIDRAAIIVYLIIFTAGVGVTYRKLKDIVFSINVRNVFDGSVVKFLSLSKDPRAIRNAIFLDGVRSNFFFPWNNGMNYTDNMYLYVWGRFGIICFVLFCLLLIWMILECINQKNILCGMITLSFIIFGLVLNYLYLWPTAYVFWYIAGSIYHHQKQHRIILYPRRQEVMDWNNKLLYPDQIIG